MKVLFAVSSENISEAIIKRYQKEYKEILSYKNVYYFNAILKEIQKDKTYDRIVISEDLEPFANNNYDTVDKFIFEKLDSISDEAQDSSGKETSIILICSDRRQKGNSILVKLFGIGVYNALLGNDRSMEEVCKLIKRPRTKKEAKIYYRIDSEDVNYKAENENEVSEVEIQNILSHFKKLGKNTAKYSDSFNNIAVQYNNEQLKIIVNCLPINVKAELEANCEKYQELMAVTGGISSVKNMVASTGSIENAVKKEISSKNVGQAGNITKPIVIPSAVRNARNQAQVLKKPVNPVTNQNVIAKKVLQSKNTNPLNQGKKTLINSGELNSKQELQNSSVNKITNNLMEDNIQSNQVSAKTIQSRTIPNNQQQPIQPHSNVLNQRGSFQRQRRQMSNLPNNQVPIQEEYQKPIEIEDEILDDDFLPGMDENTIINNKSSRDEVIGLDNVEETVLPELEEQLEVDNNIATKRGRGRPRKTPVEGAVLKAKGKRGRPRKNPEESIDTDNNIMLPGMEMDNQEEFSYDEPLENSSILPGIEEDISSDQNEILPGIDFEPEDIEETMLPGMGFEDEVEYENDSILPEVEDEYTEEVSLPGLEDLDDIDIDESEYDVDYSDDNSEMLPGMEVEEDDVQDTSYNTSDLLPGIDNNYEDDVEDSILPNFDNSLDEDELIPRINNVQDNSQEMNSPYNNMNSNSNKVESIRPKVDYSMSSLNSLITKDKKIAAFIGTSKNGVSFLVNNLAALFSSLGINTAILDMTKNKNSYYIYTKNEDELRNIAFNSIEKLQNGYAEGIKVDKNLTVYTALPNDGKDYSNAEPILSTLVQSHSLVLIDCDYDTDLTYFASCQELYLVQSMDILTIQPLTAFLRELKTNGILEPEKIRVVINKELKVKSLSIKAIIGGLSYYNDPAMSFMTELFNKDMVKACTIPFEDNAYSKYLEGIVNCNISLNGFSRPFMMKLKMLGDMVYPLTSKQTYGKGQMPNYSQNAFSNSMNDTLNKMRKKY